MLTLDNTIGSRVWRHTQGSSKRPALDLGWGSSLPERSRPWSWTLKKVLREADGPVESDSTKSLLRVERWSPWSASRNRASVPARSPKVTSGDKRLARLISCTHHTCEYKLHCHVGNTAQNCRSGLFQDFDVARYLESTSGEILCIFESHTFVQRSWMCNQQTSLAHSSTEAEVISLDAVLRMDGIPAWSLLHPTNKRNPKEEYKDLCCVTPSNNHTHNRTKTPIQHDNNELCNVDYVTSNAKSSQFWCDALHFWRQRSSD